eukprot:TRINITY_DN836_c0_g1_i3.p1 TRINITY_DN836_c0_g1~~TRINITY_DN836_c0_g1_i3.p1  ORF type:complete len:263 (-),score=29.71 TRINITY_DN836_c0_g1_i3:726-1478(-)
MLIEKCLRRAPNLVKQAVQRSSRSLSQSTASSKLDPVQESLLQEPCILVDEKDNIIGQASKRECHATVNGTSPLHRAFSLFIFNDNGELLLQRRSDSKITFPGMWTNTCCSHPLMQGQEPDGIAGVKLAAQRRTTIELGIPEEQLQTSKMQYLTRILYYAPSNGEWGEHELDYILFLRGQVDALPNPEEVSHVEWVARDNLPEFIQHVKSTGGKLTPWFSLISQHLLPEWWKNLDHIHKFEDHNTIHKFS